MLIGFVFSRFYSKSDIGEYETLLFVASAVSFFWLRGILQTFLSLGRNNKNDVKLNTYFNSALLMVLFGSLTILFLIIFKGSITNFLSHNGEIPYFNWLLAYIFFSTPSYLIEHIFLSKNRPDSIIIYGIISYGVQFVTLAIPPILSLPIEYSIVGLVIVNILKFIYLVIVLIKYSKFEISTTFIKRHLKLAYPLIGSSLLSGSAQYIDGVIVTQFFDSSTFAIFRYGARELPLVIIMANALSNSMIPDFANLSINDALNKLKKSASGLMHLLFPTTIALLILSNWLFPLFFTSEFAVSAKIFNIYLLLVIPRMLFPQTVLIGTHHTSAILWVSLAEIVLNVSLSIILINIIGLPGVAIATFVANLFERVCLSVVVNYKYKIKIDRYLSVNWYLFYSLITIIIYVLVDYIIFN